MAESHANGADGLTTDPNTLPTDEVIVRADEIDEPPAVDAQLLDSNGLHPEDQMNVAADVADAPEAIGQQPGAPNVGTLRSPIRPILRREGSAPPPPPPRQPPPPAPPSQGDDLPQTTDSLSLGQLKNIVANFPKLESVVYAYTYEDTRTFPEELEEWFQYTQEDRDLIESSQGAFEGKFERFLAHQSPPVDPDDLHSPWLDSTEVMRLHFVRGLIEDLEKADASECLEILQCHVYIASGVWRETTARTAEPKAEEQSEFEPPNQKYLKTVAQLEAIRQSAGLLCRSRALAKIYDVVKHVCENGT